jgi:hypothetical protein
MSDLCKSRRDLSDLCKSEGLVASVHLAEPNAVGFIQLYLTEAKRPLEGGPVVRLSRGLKRRAFLLIFDLVFSCL